MVGTGRTRAGIGRRRLLGGMALGSAGAAFLAACSGGSSKNDATPGGSASQSTSAAGTTAAAETPRPGGQLRIAETTQPPHFSPFHPGADGSFVNVWRGYNGYYEQLWTFKSVNIAERLAPRLAAKIEQPDETTYIATLNQATFHNRPPVNGREVTAEDVVSTIQFISKPPASSTSFIQGGKDLKSTTAVDARTVRFETFGPRAFFYEAVIPSILPKEMLDEETLKKGPPIGSGPYEYSAHQIGSFEEVKRNSRYRLAPRPYPDGKRMTFMPDASAVEAAFRSGQIDAVEFTDVKQRDSVVKDLGSRVQTKAILSSVVGMNLVANVNRAPWSDVRVREAIYRAIDVDRVINTVYFGDAERTWYFPPTRFTRNPITFDAVKQYVGYDPKKATDLLKASGIDLNKEYELMAPVETQTWIDSARLLAEDLTKVGLKMRVNPVVRNIYLQRGGPKPGDFDLTMTLPLDLQYARTKSGTFWDSTSLQDAEVDALIDKIEQTVDVKARDKLLEDFQMVLARKYSNFIPMIALRRQLGWYAYVKGYNAEYDNNLSWQDDLWIDKK